MKSSYDLWSVSFAHEMSNESVSALRYAVNLFLYIANEIGRTRASRILRVNFYNVEHTESLTYLCSHWKTERNKQMAKCNIQSTVIVWCALRSSPFGSALLCMVHWARVCVSVLTFVDSLSLSLSFQAKRPFIIIPTKCHSFHGWRSKSNLTNTSSAHIHIVRDQGNCSRDGKSIYTWRSNRKRTKMGIVNCSPSCGRCDAVHAFQRNRTLAHSMRS